MAMYLIRRRPWVVTVPAASIVPRMEVVRRLLGLAPPGVLDLLRKNPNLLRLEPAVLRGRYEALHRSTGFDAAQVCALGAGSYVWEAMGGSSGAEKDRGVDPKLQPKERCTALQPVMKMVGPVLSALA